VESSCELGNEPSGSIKCWELPRGCTSCGLSSGTQLHRVRRVQIIHLRLYIYWNWNNTEKSWSLGRNRVLMDLMNLKSGQLSVVRLGWTVEQSGFDSWQGHKECSPHLHSGSPLTKVVWSGYLTTSPCGYSGRSVKLTTHLHMELRSRIAELYLR
jgi:hypothetical protein